MKRYALPVGFAVFVGLPLLFLVSGFFLPKDLRVERSVVIPAAPERVFALLDSAQEWASYHRGERQMGSRETFEITGLSEGPGSGIQYYVSDRLVATYTIREIDAPKRIEYGFSWETAPVKGTGAFILTREGSGTRVTRQENARIGPSPVYRWLALTLEQGIGDDFDKFFLEFAKDFESN